MKRMRHWEIEMKAVLIEAFHSTQDLEDRANFLMQEGLPADDEVKAKGYQYSVVRYKLISIADTNHYVTGAFVPNDVQGDQW